MSGFSFRILPSVGFGDVLLGKRLGSSVLTEVAEKKCPPNQFSLGTLSKSTQSLANLRF